MISRRVNTRSGSPASSASSRNSVFVSWSGVPSTSTVVDRTGGGDHFQVTVTSGRFDGLSLVDQHRLVYAALETPLGDGTIHELRIKTKGVGGT